MSGGHLSNDDFFQKLSKLFDERRKKDHGSVFLTQKRMTYGPEDDDNVEMDEDSPKPAPTTTTTKPEEPLFPGLALVKPLPIIIRATNGKSKENRDRKIKLSTVVEADALEGFFAKYAEVCKLGMSGLKKRDRSKGKQKLKAKKKKLGGGAPAEIKKV